MDDFAFSLILIISTCIVGFILSIVNYSKYQPPEDDDYPPWADNAFIPIMLLTVLFAALGFKACNMFELLRLAYL